MYYYVGENHLVVFGTDIKTGEPDVFPVDDAKSIFPRLESLNVGEKPQKLLLWETLLEFYNEYLPLALVICRPILMNPGYGGTGLFGSSISIRVWRRPTKKILLELQTMYDGLRSLEKYEKLLPFLGPKLQIDMEHAEDYSVEIPINRRGEKVVLWAVDFG